MTRGFAVQYPVRMRGVSAVLVLAAAAAPACGRIGFDRPADAAETAAADSGSDAPGDGAPLDDATISSDAPTPDAMATACANAIPVTVGVNPAVTTCSGFDRLDACVNGKEEVVFKFVVPQTGGYNFRARNPGTMNVSNSTGRLNPGCTAVGSCSGILGTSLVGGTTEYFVVEASSGMCATIEFEVF